MGYEGIRQHVTEGKANFDHLYDLPDPRPLFRTLEPLGYRIPEDGQRIFGLLLAALRRSQESLTILDVCCSYGINSALLRCDLTLKDLYERYVPDDLDDVSHEKRVDADRAFFAGRRREPAPRMLGLDTAGKAVTYAVQVGLLDQGYSQNLECDEPSADLTAALAKVDLITVTGGVGYLSERTFDRLLAAAGERRPWLATFPLRTVAYEPIAEVASGHGLITERLAGRSFLQRAFLSEQEQHHAVRAVRERGLDPAGMEAEGFFYADFYLSRPSSQVTAPPLDWLHHEVGRDG